MKRIILSIGVIAFVGALTVGVTGAFFNDTETSTGNTFTAGTIDLQIDNTSYYNGVFSTTTSWTLRDLTIEKFFNFSDLKPGDRGEDTISIHAGTNPSWLCADVKLTSNNENTLVDPEATDGDVTSDPNGGELANQVNFIWWADDGDNVLETNEAVLPGGPLGAIPVGGTATVALTDSDQNIFGTTTEPFPGNVTKYIGKAWCFGNIVPAPLVQDGLGTTSPRTPANSTGGIACDGSQVNNTAQTDSLTADITFRDVQARNNPSYQCVQPQ